MVEIPLKNSTLQLPKRLGEKLSENQALEGAIKLNLTPFSNWFANSGVPFFPEYTDHGPQHVEGVLVSASSLITDEAWDILAPEDAAVLVLSVLLHDAGMHLSEDGFLELIDRKIKRELISGFADRGWPALWEEFTAEAKRFDDRKLVNLFGDLGPALLRSMKPADWSERDRKLIGEFVRRNHHRLAHEIALWGAPGPGHPTVRDRLALVGIDSEMVDLAGVVARSHGLPLRDCADYLLRKYGNKREVKNSHPVFLMTLVRIADYLQIDSERAHQEILKVKKLRSPISRREWNVHHAVLEIQTEHDDPELVRIRAKPDDVLTFLRLKELLSQLQAEIDSSWATLGEVFGSSPRLKSLGMTLRRVSSNIDDAAEFAKIVNYVPVRAAFEVAHAELLKLLIGPLYGNRPEIGVRELIQNSVDAVRELWELQKQRPVLRDIDLPEQEVDVLIELYKDEENDWWLTCSDKGIGMTPEVVKDYFLKAGASYRHSEEWNKTFTDGDGTSKVLRSGRFGVGLMAAFLIGDEIKVTTRYATADTGLEFSGRIHDEAIEMRNKMRPVGTTVSIRLGEEQKRNVVDKTEENELRGSGDWDKSWFAKSNWYFLSRPSIVRRNKVLGLDLPANTELPPSRGELPAGWRRVIHQDFEDIHWTYAPMNYSVYSNGISVERRIPFPIHSLPIQNGPRELFCFSVPTISVFDRDGRLPVNVVRDRLEGALPFESELLEEVSKDFISFLLTTLPSTESESSRFYSLPNYHGLYRDFTAIHRGKIGRYFGSLALGDLGIYLFHPYNLQLAKCYTALVMAKRTETPRFIHNVNDSICVSDWSRGEAFELAREAAIWLKLGRSWLKGFRLFTPLIDSEFREFHIAPKTEFDDGEYRVLAFGDVLPTTFDFENAAKSFRKSDLYNLPTVVEICLANSSPTEPEPGPATAWKKYIRSPYIPWELRERQRLLASTYDELKDYIAVWEKELGANR